MARRNWWRDRSEDRQEAREARAEARAEAREARAEARAEARQAREEAREARMEARAEAREAREEAREARMEAREEWLERFDQSDIPGSPAVGRIWRPEHSKISWSDWKRAPMVNKTTTAILSISGRTYRMKAEAST